MTDTLDDVRRALRDLEDVDLPDDLARPAAAMPPSGDADMPPPPGQDGEEDPPERRAAEFPLNDTGNGRRFALHFGADALFVPRIGWFTWTGQVWRKDPDEMAIRAMGQQMGPLVEKECAWIISRAARADLLARQSDLRARFRGLSEVPRKDRSAEQETELREVSDALSGVDQELERVQDLIGQRLRHAKQAGNTNQINNMLREGGVHLARVLDDLDADPMCVNTQSGALRFSVASDPDAGMSRTAQVELIPHDRSQLMTKMMPVQYDPTARAPRFEAFLARIQPDGTMRGFLQRWFGLSMTGITIQKLCFFYGDGANGKSVLVDLMARILGDYAATAKIESLTGSNRRGGGDATPDLVPMIGSRMVRASEPDQGMQWQEGLIKELTGGEEILIRALHSDFVAVRPKFKLTLSGNHKPDIRGTDDGIWRRLALVPFDVQIPKSEQIPKEELDALLFEERDGVFRWMVDGLLDFLEGGLAEPEQVLTATQEFREESDPVGAFLEEACVVSGDGADVMNARDLVNAFHFWMIERAEGGWKDRTVALKLKDRSKRWRSKRSGQKFAELKSGGISKYTGIRLGDLFRRRFDLAPKDQSGKPIGTRTGTDGGED